MACKEEFALKEHNPHTIQLLASPSNFFFNLNNWKVSKNPKYIFILVPDGWHALWTYSSS